jgi:ubiquinone/menaquinone biosynthesis C-methylase UbiE
VGTVQKTLPYAALALAALSACNVGPARSVSDPQARPQAARYVTHAIHDEEGTGKFYFGRQIAKTMGRDGIAWLERAQRANEERPQQLLAALALRGGETVVDLGAGSGYYVRRLAPLVGPQGRVIAVEVQPAMLAALRENVAAEQLTNVEVVEGGEQDPKLATNSVDLALLVDVYHEFAYPYEMMGRVREALKPGGRVVLVEYRAEDAGVPIKALHRMSAAQIRKEMDAVGLTYLASIETLPWQHIVLFRK